MGGFRGSKTVKESVGFFFLLPDIPFLLVVSVGDPSHVPAFPEVKVGGRTLVVAVVVAQEVTGSTPVGVRIGFRGVLVGEEKTAELGLLPRG